MITVEQATQLVLNTAFDFGTEKIHFQKAMGRILNQELHADRDFPPFDRVSMDGIAIKFEAFEAGSRSFPVERMQAAGAPQSVLENNKNCMEVMTGSILPANTDTVIRYEDVEIADGVAKVQVGNVTKGQNVHYKGSDRRMGDVLVATGTSLSAAEIGVAATTGRVDLEVAKMPRVTVISTGDELVDVERLPLPHQIRKSNVFSVASVLMNWGIEPQLLHLNDDEDEIKEVLKEALQTNEVIILSGGISEGKFDFLPKAFQELGVTKLFHKISQRPGKPFWFGHIPSKVAVFALPGNPVSTFMCLHRYVQPWLRASLGLAPFQNSYAVLSEDFFFQPPLTYFLQVRLHSTKQGKLMAVPVAGKGSGDLANLTEADAFMELSNDKTNFRSGEVFPVFRFR